MTAVVQIIERHGDFLVSSETIAEGAGVEHRAVLQIIGTYAADLEEFGGVAFEMRPFETAGGTQARRIALLNEQQATLLMTYQRNTDQVRFFKKALVRAFYDVARAVVPVESPEQLMARALVTAQGVIERKDEQIAALAPRAEAWDELASAEGDYSVADASSMLNRAGINIGPQRLFKKLGEMGWTYRGEARRWRPYAKTVDAGYMTERAMPPRIDHDGIQQPVPPQVRVTARGLERLRVRLGIGALAAVEVAS